MNQLETTAIFIYILLVAIVIALEHKYVFPRWKRYERPRWALGIGSLIALIVPFVFSGVADLFTVFLFFLGALSAGAVVWLMDVETDAAKRHHYADELRQKLDSVLDDESENT